MNQSKNQPATSSFDYDGAMQTIRKLKSDITDLQSKIIESQRDYTIYTSQKKISDQISKDDKLGESDKNITDAFTKLVGGCSDLQQ